MRSIVVFFLFSIFEDAAYAKATRAEVLEFIRTNGVLDRGCRDYDAECPTFAAAGQCSDNPEWTLVNCPKSCVICIENGRNTPGSTVRPQIISSATATNALAEWTTWTNCQQCSPAKQTGTQSRQRQCVNSDYGDCTSTGLTFERRPCPCQASSTKLGFWTNWCECTVTCGNSGFQTRTRQESRSGGGQGVVTEHRPCQPQQPSCGQWQPWTPWSRCPVTCYSAPGAVPLTTCDRTRSCFPPGEQCVGETRQTRTCCQNLPPCAAWNQWGSWSQCTRTCGATGQSSYCDRTRSCFPPTDTCLGESRQTRICCEGLPQCSQWSQWGQWSQCPVTCGSQGLNQYCRRTRSCLPSANGCFGQSTQNQVCCQGLTQCSQWNQWGPWSQCPITCRSGSYGQTQYCHRARSCYPSTNACTGQSKQTQFCCESLPQCRQPKWSEWSPWSQPSVTCQSSSGSDATAACRRSRYCIPADGGCQGEPRQLKFCSSAHLPSCATWAKWSHWSYCTATCGNGQRSRHRLCNGLGCPGTGYEVLPCQLSPTCSTGYGHEYSTQG